MAKVQKNNEPAKKSKTDWFVKKELRLLSDHRIIKWIEITQKMRELTLRGHSSEVAAALVCRELIPSNGHKLQLIDKLLGNFANHAASEEDALFIEHIREEAIREIKEKKK